MNGLTLGEILPTLHKLPSLPTVVLTLLQSLDKETVNIDVLANQIELDQALTARTLQLANSSFYGMAHQVATIQEAIVILGFRTVRNLVTTAALMNALVGSTPTRFNAKPFWRHSIAVAICTRALASHLHLNPEQAYTAGLLHDIGRLTLVTQFPSHYQQIMTYRAEHDCSPLQAELAVLGLDHAQIGHALTGHSKFPQELQQAVALHHAPLIETGQMLSLLVRAADAIVHALDLSLEADDLVPPVPSGLWQLLGFDDQTLLQIFKSTEEQFVAASVVYHI